MYLGGFSGSTQLLGGEDQPGPSHGAWDPCGLGGSWSVHSSLLAISSWGGVPVGPWLLSRAGSLRMINQSHSLAAAVKQIVWLLMMLSEKELCFTCGELATARGWSTLRLLVNRMGTSRLRWRRMDLWPLFLSRFVLICNKSPAKDYDFSDAVIDVWPAVMGVHSLLQYAKNHEQKTMISLKQAVIDV